MKLPKSLRYKRNMYYFEDLGLRNSLKGFNQVADTHKIVKNAVYLHLIQCHS